MKIRTIITTIIIIIMIIIKVIIYIIVLVQGGRPWHLPGYIECRLLVKHRADVDVRVRGHP